MNSLWRRQRQTRKTTNIQRTEENEQIEESEIKKIDLTINFMFTPEVCSREKYSLLQLKEFKTTNQDFNYY